MSQDDPLSVDLTIFPELPTPTNPSGVAEDELSDEDEVELSAVLVELSEELSGEPFSTPSHLISLHEETITAMLTIRTNQEVRLFILSFKENDQEDVYKTVSSSDCPIKQKNEQKLNTNLLLQFLKQYATICKNKSLAK